MLLVFSLTIYRITILMRVVCIMAIYNYLFQQIANLFSDF